MHTNGRLFTYVNLPGGYGWVTLDGGALPAAIDEVLQKPMHQVMSNRQDREIATALDDAIDIKAFAIYDETGEDETGRRGLVFVIGAFGPRNFECDRPNPKEIDFLLALRADLVRLRIPLPFAKLAFAGGLARLRTDALPAPNNPEIKPQAGEVPREDQPIRRLEIAVATALLLSLLALVFSAMLWWHPPQAPPTTRIAAQHARN